MAARVSLVGPAMQFQSKDFILFCLSIYLFILNDLQCFMLVCCDVAIIETASAPKYAFMRILSER